MTEALPELELGAYRLVRLHRSKHLRIYTVHPESNPELRLAELIRVTISLFGIDEWQVRCSEPGCGEAKFPERDRALAWLGRHRVTKHPNEVRRHGV